MTKSDLTFSIGKNKTITLGDEDLSRIYNAYAEHAKEESLNVKLGPEDHDDDEKVELWSLADDSLDSGAIYMDDMFEESYTLIYSLRWLIGLYKLFDAILRARYRDPQYYVADNEAPVKIMLSPGDCADIQYSLAYISDYTVILTLDNLLRHAIKAGSSVTVVSSAGMSAKKKGPIRPPTPPEEEVEEEGEEIEEEDEPEEDLGDFGEEEVEIEWEGIDEEEA